MKMVCIENEFNKGLKHVGGIYDITIGKIYDVEVYNGQDVIGDTWVRISCDDAGISSVYPINCFIKLDKYRNEKIQLLFE